MIFPSPSLWLPNPRVFYSPGYPCCCGDQGCENCTGTTPGQLQIVLADIVNDNCTKCTDANGTFVLDRLPFSYGAGCYYEYEFSNNDAECVEGYGPASILAVFHHAGMGGNAALEVNVYFPYGATPTACWLTFNEDVGQGWPFDCTTLGVPTPQNITLYTSYEGPYGSKYCDFSTPPTCTAAAL